MCIGTGQSTVEGDTSDLPASTDTSAAMKLSIEIDIQPDEIALATELLQFLRLGVGEGLRRTGKMGGMGEGGWWKL